MYLIAKTEVVSGEADHGLFKAQSVKPSNIYDMKLFFSCASNLNQPTVMLAIYDLSTFSVDRIEKMPS